MKKILICLFLFIFILVPVLSVEASIVVAPLAGGYIPPVCMNQNYDCSRIQCVHGYQRGDCSIDSGGICTIASACSPSICQEDSYNVQWSDCVNNIEYSSFAKNEDCVGGYVPLAQQSCTPIPTCQASSFSYGDWQSCSNNTSYRQAYNLTKCVGGFVPVTQEACPTCQESSFVYGDWTPCTNNNVSVRAVSKNENCSGGYVPATQKGCQTNQIISTSTTSIPPIAQAIITSAQVSGISTIQNIVNQLSENKIDSLLSQLNELKNTVLEQATQIKYLQGLVKNVPQISSSSLVAINNFITYGVDSNTVALGAGQRAAVVNSFKAAFNKLPTTQTDLTDVVKIADGRWPSQISTSSESWAKQQFQKIYLRRADMNNANDNAAITIMAYGLQQQAKNRNLKSEAAGIKTFKYVYGRTPNSAKDWNVVGAITYSGAKR
jgi:hypothetical protein